MFKWLFPNKEHKVKVIRLIPYIQMYNKTIDGVAIPGTQIQREHTRIIIEIIEACPQATKKFPPGKRFSKIEETSIVAYNIDEEFVTGLQNWISC